MSLRSLGLGPSLFNCVDANGAFAKIGRPFETANFAEFNAVSSLNALCLKNLG